MLISLLWFPLWVSGAEPISTQAEEVEQPGNARVQATQQPSNDHLSLAFLEFLGDMVEANDELLDPLAFDEEFDEDPETAAEQVKNGSQ